MTTHRQLAEQIAQYAELDGIIDTSIPRLALVRSGQLGEPVHMVQRPALCIIAQGGKRVLLGDAVIDYGPASYLVASLDLPITGAVTQASADAPYLCFCLYLDPALLSEIALTLPRPPAGAEDGAAMTLHPMTPELIDAATRMTALLGNPTNAPLLAPLIERELLVRLMTGSGGRVLRAIASSESRTGQVAQAIAWLKAHFREPFSGPQLAALAGMSLSSFHDHFRRATAMTPLQYQKQLRLQEARALMLADRLDAAEAGYRVGYDSPSQFSREYRRLFGAPPVRDIGRLRATPQIAIAI
jgi:AraC-like DNA-binding protein